MKNGCTAAKIASLSGWDGQEWEMEENWTDFVPIILYYVFYKEEISDGHQIWRI